jgi:hypothetical protein
MKKQGNDSPCIPFQGILSFLRPVLLGPRGLRTGTDLYFISPKREVRWVRVSPGLQLVLGAIQYTQRNISSKVEPISQAKEIDPERLAKPSSIYFPQ